LVKETGDLLADSHNVLNRWRNYFCQLLNIDSINDVRQMEMCTDKLLVPEPGPLKLEIDTKKLKIHKFPCIDQGRTDPSSR
jgi:hypothetical protein